MAYSKQRKDREQKREPRKEINVDNVASYLQSAFNWATRHMGFKNSRGTKLYEYQCEMAWLVHEITKGPIYIAPKVIIEANELLDHIVEEAIAEGRHFEEEEMLRWRKRFTS